MNLPKTLCLLISAISLAVSGDDKAVRAVISDDFRAISWRSVGPANMGGRVSDISLVPGDSKSYYVAFGTGGLWKTTNNGTTFSPVFDECDTLCIGSVVVADAPADWLGWKEEEQAKKPEERKNSKPEDLKAKGKGKIVWVGTGEGNGRNSSSWGNGVYRSTDAGATFKNVGLKNVFDIPRLAVDPRNPDVCYAAAMGRLWGKNKERGLFKTENGGKSWKHILSVDDSTGCIDVILDPRNPDTVFAAMYSRHRTAWSFQSGSEQGGIFRSKDGGRSWEKLSKGLPSQTGRIGLDIYQKDPSIVMAVVESDEGGVFNTWDDRSKTGGVFRSEDGGDTWVRLHSRSPRAFYFSKIRIDPTDDKRVYLLGWNIDVSDDGGKTFKGGLTRKLHVDMHAMVIDPADNKHLIIGNDGGVYQSFDRGETWDFLNTMAVGQFYNVACDMSDPYRIAGGLQDNGSWMGPSGTNLESGWDGQDMGGITNADWRTIGGGDGFHCAFDPQDPNIVYSESQGGELYRVDLATGKWRVIRPQPKEGQPRYRFNWNSPFFVSVHNPTTLYFGGNYVFKLTQRGDNWERISHDLSTRNIEKIDSVGSEAETHGTVVSLAESPLAAGMLWAGTDDGLLHLSVDDGKHWRNITPKAVNGWYISKIEPSHHDKNTAYVAIDGHRSDNYDPHLLMTTDAGDSWHDVTGDLPKGWPARCIREDLKNPNVLYCGTEVGMYFSYNMGKNWIKINGKSLPPVAVHDIVQHPRENDLILATHGRSIYIWDDATCFSEMSDNVAKSSIHLFDILPAKPRHYLPYDGLWTDKLFKAQNPPMGAKITYWVKEYSPEDSVKIKIEDKDGKQVVELTGPNRPGVNRVIWDLQRDAKERIPNNLEAENEKIFVPSGDYKVTVTYAKASSTKTLSVLPAPSRQ